MRVLLSCGAGLKVVTSFPNLSKKYFSAFEPNGPKTKIRKRCNAATHTDPSVMAVPLEVGIGRKWESALSGNRSQLGIGFKWEFVSVGIGFKWESAGSGNRL